MPIQKKAISAARLGGGSRSRLLIRGGLLAGLLALVVVDPASAAPLGQPAMQEGGAPIASVLLPFLAAAATVERILELGWNYIEWLLIRFGKWEGDSLKSASYVQFKSGTSLLAGLFLGVVVANYSGMRLLGFLQPMAGGFLGAVPVEWDIILTGIIIGAGSKPAHDILCLITHLKNLTGNSALHQRERAAEALSRGVRNMAEADAPYRTEVPGMGVARVARSLEEEGDEPQRETSEERLDRYARTLHGKLYMGS
jgi:hypothetical protein